MKTQKNLMACIVALSSLAFLVVGYAAYAACANSVTTPSCVDTTTSSEDPGFDLTNGCSYTVALNISATDLDITFRLSERETMSSELLPEVPSDDLEILTNAYADGTLSIKCCPDFSRFAHCSPPTE